jgi:hypothetical protein
LGALRERGVNVAEVIGWLGWSLGCLPQPDACRPDELAELIKRFDWVRVPLEPVRVPEGWA